MACLGGITTNKEFRQARKVCARCNHIFESNEFKVMTDDNQFICGECNDKLIGC